MCTRADNGMHVMRNEPLITEETVTSWLHNQSHGIMVNKKKTRREESIRYSYVMETVMAGVECCG